MKPVSYYLKSKNNIDIVNTINVWEDCRCACGYEDLFDLTDYHFFVSFVERYGIQITRECIKKSYFWLGGSNFKSPIKVEPTTELVDTLISYEEILDENNRDLYKPYFYIENMEYDYNLFSKRGDFIPNTLSKRELHYPIILQYMTLELVKFYQDNKEKCNDVFFEELLDEIANLAFEFTERFKKTFWHPKYSFEDYLYNFISCKLEDNEISFVKEDYSYDLAKEYLRKIFGK